MFWGEKSLEVVGVSLTGGVIYDEQVFSTVTTSRPTPGGEQVAEQFTKRGKLCNAARFFSYSRLSLLSFQ